MYFLTNFYECVILLKIALSYSKKIASTMGVPEETTKYKPVIISLLDTRMTYTILRKYF